MPEDLNPKAKRARADGKPRLELLTPCALSECADVLAHGAEKYGVRNYVEGPINISTYVGAILRHTLAWAAGADADPDSGFSHLAHIEACVHVVQAAELAQTLVDDRHFAETIETASAHTSAGDGSEMPWVAMRSEDTRRASLCRECLNSGYAYCRRGCVR
jgi:hypothetical protein